MAIPIENIYYLLSYAWDKLDEKERVNVSIDDKTELLDLFAKILINVTKILHKKGIDKSYIDHTEELSGIKGKIQISQTLKRNLLFKQKTICTFDDFSSNIISNKILVTTIYKLTRTEGLDKKLKNELVSLRRLFGGIDQIEITSPIFKQVKVNRNNRIYGFIMNICQIIHENTLPSEEEGKFKFSDFTRDERKMNKLFEAFVKNFYKKEQSKFPTVKGEYIEWQFNDTKKESSKYLPIMKTDVTLQNDNQKIIIDAKFYKETLKINYDKERIISGNLYQIFSYLVNQEVDKKTLKTTGILLYPTIEKDYDLDFKYNEHNIQIRTVNLNTDWEIIKSRLLDIIHCQ